MRVSQVARLLTSNVSVALVVAVIVFVNGLEKLLATLKPRERTVIQLLDLEERTVQETCNLTGWGASKVKVTAMRARRKLREQLQRLERRGSAGNSGDSR